MRDAVDTFLLYIFVIAVVSAIGYQATVLWRRHNFMRACARVGEFEKCEVLFEANDDQAMRLLRD
jgi:hypothetical protein